MSLHKTCPPLAGAGGGKCALNGKYTAHIVTIRYLNYTPLPPPAGDNLRNGVRLIFKSEIRGRKPP